MIFLPPSPLAEILGWQSCRKRDAAGHRSPCRESAVTGEKLGRVPLLNTDIQESVLWGVNGQNSFNLRREHRILSPSVTYWYPKSEKLPRTPAPQNLLLNPLEFQQGNSG